MMNEVVYTGIFTMRINLKHAIKRTIFFKALESMREYRYFLKSSFQGSFSQQGEDRFLMEYFDGKPGTYIDIGANHPFVISNTYLLYRNGWKGLTVEPITHLAKLHDKWRPKDRCIRAGVDKKSHRMQLYEFSPSGLSTFDSTKAEHLVNKGALLVRTCDIQLMPLSEIYVRHEDFLGSVDLLSIDTEGMDLRVLQSNDFSLFKPELIICELPRSRSEQEELEVLLSQQGYFLIKTIGFNVIYKKRCS